MTSIIRFEAISGVMGDTPPAYVLQVDEFRFLLDCGLDEMFSQSYINQLANRVKQIDAVLISHPDCQHLGCLPYLVGKCGLNCEIYATTPVYQMGQMFMYDLFQSRHNSENFELFTLDDVDSAFDKVIQIKYNQTVALKGKGQGLTITPLPAGHMIGGTIWRIVKDGEEDIVYAIDYNHKKERHLNGCVLETIIRPSLLITDAFNADYVQERRRKRDEQLMTNILGTLRSGGNVLIAVDTAGRVLELAHMLDQLWRNQESGLITYSLALLNNFSYNVIEFAKALVEWMSDKLRRAFEVQRINPFLFKHLQLCHKYSDLERILEPRVVLASQPDIECGYSRDLFFNWSTNPKNCIILTQRCSAGTLAHQLMNSQKGRLITLEIKQRVPLKGLELEEYRRQEKLKKSKTSSTTDPSVVESDSDSDDNESEDEDESMELEGVGNKSPVSATYVSSSGTSSQHLHSHSSAVKHDLMMPKSEGKVKGGGFFKQAKKSYPMFPAPERKVKWDEYGETVRPEDFVIFDVVGANTAQTGEEENKENVKKDGLEESAPEAHEVPTKCVVNVQTFNIHANIQYIDFEGRSDGESIKKIIAMIKPRRLILVRGSPEATESLYNFSKPFVSDGVFKPKLLETVDATRESHIYQVKLKDSLVSSLSFAQSKEGAQLSWVEGQIEMTQIESLLPQTEAERTAESVATEGQQNNGESSGLGGRELLPTLRQLPANQIPSHPTIFVNELKLSDFKQVLMKNGIQAEFSGGVLYCNNQVEVRRSELGRIHLEGTLSEDYFKVRQLLYEQYAII